MLTQLSKSQLRAALEPARVFGRRDFNDDSVLPLYRFWIAGEPWYSPHWPSWLIKYEPDEKVLARAIDRYGVVDAQVTDAWEGFADRLLTRSLITESWHAPLTFSLRNGQEFSGYVSTVGIVPVTPVAYTLRRFGEDVKWRVSVPMHTATGWVDDNAVIAIRVIKNEYVTEVVAGASSDAAA